jgi:hypothetical protein
MCLYWYNVFKFSYSFVYVDLCCKRQMVSGVGSGEKKNNCTGKKDIERSRYHMNFNNIRNESTSKYETQSLIHGIHCL